MSTESEKPQEQGAVFQVCRDCGTEKECSERKVCLMQLDGPLNAIKRPLPRIDLSAEIVEAILSGSKVQFDLRDNPCVTANGHVYAPYPESDGRAIIAITAYSHNPVGVQFAVREPWKQNSISGAYSYKAGTNNMAVDFQPPETMPPSIIRLVLEIVSFRRLSPFGPCGGGIVAGFAPLFVQNVNIENAKIEPKVEPKIETPKATQPSAITDEIREEAAEAKQYRSRALNIVEVRNGEVIEVRSFVIPANKRSSPIINAISAEFMVVAAEKGFPNASIEAFNDGEVDELENGDHKLFLVTAVTA